MKQLFDNLLTQNEQKILLFLVVFAFLGLLVGDAFLTADRKDDTIQEVDFGNDFPVKYDLQTANIDDLITIPGIGEKRANDILAYRAENGFVNKTDLMKVKGIGKSTYLKIEPYFYDFGNSDVADSNGYNETRSRKINLNTADVQQLTLLPGIGPSKAEKIILLRQELGTFTEVEELLKVKGIGPKTLDKMKPMITLKDED
jgi:competence protein ComEA